MRKEVDMTSGNLFKKLLIVAVPLMLSGILQLLYTAADLIVCGSFGSEHSVAAISSTNSLVSLTVNLFMGLSVGANVVMAKYFGAKNQEKGQKIVYTAMITSVVGGIIIGIFGFFMARPFLKMMDSPSDVIDLSSLYLKIYFLGIPFSMVYNFGSAILRATGDTKRPFIYLALSGLINVILNLFFVIIFDMDVAGVALATIISQAVSAILIVICMIRNHGFFHFKVCEIKFYKTEFLEIIKVGIPAGLQGTIFSLSNVLIQSSINGLGTIVMDGCGASSSLEGFVYVSMNSIATACVAFVSANFGAKNKQNIIKVIKYTSLLVIIMNFIIGLIILLHRDFFLGLYVSNPESIAAGKEKLTIMVTTYFLCGLMDTFAYSLRGIGYSVIPTIVSLLGACGMRVLWVFTAFRLPSLHNPFGVALSYPISWIITLSVHFIIFVILFRKIKFQSDFSIATSD